MGKKCEDKALFQFGANTCVGLVQNKVLGTCRLKDVMLKLFRKVKDLLSHQHICRWACFNESFFLLIMYFHFILFYSNDWQCL